MSTDLDKQSVVDPALDAENALSEKLITGLLWMGGGLFAVWIAAMALFL